MRFAWLRENNGLSVNQTPTDVLIFVVYNVVYWIPLVLALTNLMDYGTAFTAFAVIVAIRTLINLYRNNVLPVEQGVSFPLRAP